MPRSTRFFADCLPSLLPSPQAPAPFNSNRDDNVIFRDESGRIAQTRTLMVWNREMRR